jgi:hypothetical protein
MATAERAGTANIGTTDERGSPANIRAKRVVLRNPCKGKEGARRGEESVG